MTSKGSVSLFLGKIIGLYNNRYHLNRSSTGVLDCVEGNDQGPEERAMSQAQLSTLKGYSRKASEEVIFKLKF